MKTTNKKSISEPIAVLLSEGVTLPQIKASLEDGEWLALAQIEQEDAEWYHSEVIELMRQESVNNWIKAEALYAKYRKAKKADLEARYIAYMEAGEAAYQADKILLVKGA